jgi:acetate kinase
MGTRSGDVDPAAVIHLWRAGLGMEEIDAALNRSSGMLALAGENDLREVHRRIADGDPDAQLALDVYCHRIRKYVGAYLAVLGGRIDAVVFTAGVGENDAEVRARSLAGLEPLGIEVDPSRNGMRSGEARAVSPEGAPVAVLVVPTDEELEMALEAATLVDADR